MGIHKIDVSKVLGDPEIQEQRPTRQWSLGEGTTTTRHFMGPAEKIERYFNELSVNVAQSNMDNIAEQYTGKKGELLVSIYDDTGGGVGENTEALNAVWELYAQDLYRPIESHPDFDAILATTKREIEKKAREGESLAAGASAAEKTLYAYYGNQVLNYLSTDLLLRKTTSVSSRTTITATYENLNKVVTIASIDPPTAILGALTSLPRLGTDDGEWEWLKKGPQIRQITKMKYQLSYTWWGASRWAKIYGGTWEPTYE